MSIMKDGFSTLISFSADSSVQIAHKTLTPPGFSDGGEIDVTTMLNTGYRTKAPKSLIDVTPCSFSAAWDPATYVEMQAMVGINQQITVTFPDASTIVFWGWISEFNPGEQAEGAQPMVDISIIVSNLNGSDVETGPVYSAAP